MDVQMTKAKSLMDIGRGTMYSNDLCRLHSLCLCVFFVFDLQRLV